MKTADGRLQDVKAITVQQTPPAQPSDLESSNPLFSSNNAAGKSLVAGKFGLPEDYEEKTNRSCMVRCGEQIEKKNCKICLGVCFAFIIIFAILIGVLFPRFPTVDVDRNETADGIEVRYGLDSCYLTPIVFTNRLPCYVERLTGSLLVSSEHRSLTSSSWLTFGYR